jgi:hypothetical protein
MSLLEVLLGWCLAVLGTRVDVVWLCAVVRLGCVVEDLLGRYAALFVIPAKVTRRPRKLGNERGYGVNERVADEHVVVDGYERGDEQRASTYASEHGHHFPHVQWAKLGVLRYGDFQEEKRQSDQKEHDHERNHESAFHSAQIKNNN